MVRQPLSACGRAESLLAFQSPLPIKEGGRALLGLPGFVVELDQNGYIDGLQQHGAAAR
jgi:hypothetical protein